ncbi:hypothetical protein ACHAWO_012464 [Cyclotella atomus]|uniref:DUF676 domain-containing protein n=1 Tax=Cyclotella atomus TaxID=382360 RepID=A0ABD3QW56_9STRA
MGATQSSCSSNTALSSDPDTTNDSTVATQDDVPAPPKSSSQITLLSQHHHEPYKAPTSPIHPLAHYIFLVHGWLGNDLEMGYLSESFAKCIAKEGGDTTAIDGEEEGHDSKRMKRSNSQLLAADAAGESTYPHHPPVVVHSVKCNVGKTHDGIKNGGTRLAREIVDFIQSDLQKLQSSNAASSASSEKEGHVTYSIVGNSLGGLYARYAISLVPRQLCIPRPIKNNTNNDATSYHSSQQKIHIHPNTFLTTATPHLGVSQHTYLPLPRIAETIIGSGMGVTGTDLFRLNSDKTGRENVIGAGVRKLSGARGVLGPWRSNPNTSSNDENNADSSENSTEEVDQEMECIIRNMCLQERYLGPLRNFQRRIAYANAYRTDFQVPTETAAFLNADSNVVHTVVACRDVNVEEGKRDRDENHVPPFVVAVVTTEQQPPNPDKVEPSASETTTPNEELLQMSQSLDALGWTKFFIDVRNRIPLPGIPKPSWRLLPFPSVLSTMLPEPDTPLDDLIHSRGFKRNSTEASAERPDSTKQDGVTTLTSSELIQSTNAGQTVHFPMGHTVMVANSKSDAYTKLNFQGRPVMDKLAEDMLRDVLKFE